MRSVDAPPHKEAGMRMRGNYARLIFNHRGEKQVQSVKTYSYLLSSPPELTTKRSPFVKRTLVK